MLTGGSGVEYRSILATGYTYRTRTEIWRVGGSRLDRFGDLGIPLIDGTLNATLQNRVSRNLSFTVGADLAPLDFEDPNELLNPYWNYAKSYGIVSSGAGTQYEFPIFVGRLQSNSYNSDSSTLSVSCSDFADDVINDGFGHPFSSATNKPIADQWALIIQDSQPSATFSGINVPYQQTPKLTWANDRGQALDDLAAAVNAYWYQLPSGDYTLRVVPWTQKNATVATFINGTGGVLVNYTASTDRSNVFNTITVTGERLDGKTPVNSYVQDTSPSSNTYVNGPFGRRSTVLEVQSATNGANATALGKQQILRTRAFTQTWSASTPPDPAIELGDAVLLEDKTGRQAVQVISSFTLPLTKGSMSYTFRDQQPGIVESS